MANALLSRENFNSRELTQTAGESCPSSSEPKPVIHLLSLLFSILKDHGPPYCRGCIRPSHRTLPNHHCPLRIRGRQRNSFPIVLPLCPPTYIRRAAVYPHNPIIIEAHLVCHTPSD